MLGVLADEEKGLCTVLAYYTIKWLRSWLRRPSRQISQLGPPRICGILGRADPMHSIPRYESAEASQQRDLRFAAQKRYILRYSLGGTAQSHAWQPRFCHARAH